MHIEFLVEEESCAESLNLLVPKMIGTRASFVTHVFQGKTDLLASLPARLKGYAPWLPSDWRIVVVVDRDGDDCIQLKARLERVAREKGLTTRSAAEDQKQFQVMNRIAVEELEAWFSVTSTHWCKLIREYRRH